MLHTSDDVPERPGRKGQGERPQKPLFPNPFYVLLILASTAFVLTALLYCVSPYVVERGFQKPGAGPGAGSLAFVKWLDRQGPFTLAIEFVIMLGSGCLAMATDHWFPSKPPRQRPDSTG